MLLAASLSLPEDFEVSLLHAFQELGHEVVGFDYRREMYFRGPERTNVLLAREILDFQPNLLFVVKGEVLRRGAIRVNGNCKTALMPVDDHWMFQDYYRHVASGFDFVFTPTPSFVSRYQELGAETNHIDYWCSTEHKPSAPEPEDLRQYSSDIVFIGTEQPERTAILKGLMKHYPDFALYGNGVGRREWSIPNRGRLNDYENCKKAWSLSKISLNLHQPLMQEAAALNTRFFEISAVRGFQLCDLNAGIARTGVPCATFDGIEELYDAINHYLNAPGERLEIATKAWEVAHARHEAIHRAEQICRTVGL